MIVIVDYGIGNVGSIANMLRKIGAPAKIGRTATELGEATHLILPGVGAFDTGMTNLRERGLVPVLEELVLQRGTPILGICLGMQLFAAGSEEGRSEGLGWVDATVVRFDFGTAATPLKVPHMGWNTVGTTGAGALVPEDSRFYFVHKYHIQCRDDADVVGRTTYGYEFASAIRRGNVHGVQFHPEKSHRFGMELLRRFWQGTG